MKRGATVLTILVAGLLLISCGGGSTNPNPGTSGIKKRAFITVTRPQPSGFSTTFIQIIDAAKDVESAFAVPANPSLATLGVNPTLMVLSSDKSKTLVFDAGENNVIVVDNAKEDIVGTVGSGTTARSTTLPSWTESIALSSDAKTAWVAVRNAPVTGAQTGAVEVLDISDPTTADHFKDTAEIPVPLAHWVVLSHDGKKLLVFSDQSDSVSIVDTTTNTVTATVPGFDRPVWGFFTADDSKAYILSCGAECGGTAANVRVLDMTTNTPGASVAVSGATTGLINGTTLYVAGTTAAGGRLDVVDLNSFTVTKPGIPVSEGYHGPIALAANGKLFIGAKNCTNRTDVANSGCLSIVDTSALTAVVDNANGFVTGLQPIAERNVVYVIEGGELVIYDATTNAPKSTQIDIVGNAFDVKTVD